MTQKNKTKKNTLATFMEQSPSLEVNRFRSDIRAIKTVRHLSVS